MLDASGLPAHRLRVDRAGYPYLAGHTVSVVPVLPVVLAVEWFMAFARRVAPGATVRACENVRVFCGVEIDAYDQGGNDLVLSVAGAPCADRNDLELRLSDARARPRYGARARLGSVSARPRSFSRSGSATWPFPVERAYEEHLFHTGAFRTLQTLGTCDDAGADAIAMGGRRTGLPPGTWQTDIALLDSGLQLALLWVRAQLGKPALPTSLGRLFIYRGGLYDGRAQVALRACAMDAKSVTFDASFVGEDGTPLAAMEDVQVHLLTEERWGPRAWRP